MDYRLKCQDKIFPIQCNVENSHQFTATIDNKQVNIAAKRISAHELFLIIDGKHYNVFTCGNEQEKDIQVNGCIYHIEDMDLLEQQSVKRSAANTEPSDVSPPMPSIVTRILVNENDHVEKAQSVIIVSAMKMETTLAAPYDGVVKKIHVAEGDRVTARQVLMDIDKDE
jgi:3-methylcrotonyl-CoA carboxylase alpha subunit